ncbi:carbohydrate diacid regulator [Sporolactobacillus sp. THM7-7]|nr:carbohydrate diacid regulator [Sporolactobacillus sp. THM7-7]
MMLDPQLAQKIVGEVRQLLHESIIVMDRDGIIIASTDGERVGQRHQGAVLVITRKESLIITETMSRQWPGVRAGIDLPIFFHNDVVGVIGITGEPDKVSKYGHLLQKMTELLIHESYYQKQIDFHERTLEGFVFDWLNDREWDESFRSMAKLLNINLTCDRQAVFMYVPGLARKADQTVWHELSEEIARNREDILIRWGNDHMLLLLNTSDAHREVSRAVEKWAASIVKQTGARPKMGIGSSVPARQLKQSFQQAKRALNVTTDRHPILYDQELTLEMIHEGLSTDTKKLFIERAIGSILSDNDILDTLRNLFHHRYSLKETAETMHIHINTLHYRLKKLHDLTGLDTREMRSRVILYLALMFLDDQTEKY